MIRNLVVWVIRGHVCPLGCGYRWRDVRTLDAHCARKHADEDWTVGW